MSLRMAKPSDGAGRGVETAELRHGQAEAVLREGDVEVGAEGGRACCMPTVPAVRLLLTAVGAGPMALCRPMALDWQGPCRRRWC